MFRRNTLLLIWELTSVAVRRSESCSITHLLRSCAFLSSFFPVPRCAIASRLWMWRNTFSIPWQQKLELKRELSLVQSCQLKSSLIKSQLKNTVHPTMKDWPCKSCEIQNSTFMSLCCGMPTCGNFYYLPMNDDDPLPVSNQLHNLKLYIKVMIRAMCNYVVCQTLN